MSPIHFQSKLSKIGTYSIIKLPKEASLKLPSRGMVMVEGKINDFPILAPLEPDGKGSHWLKIEKSMLDGAKLQTDNTATLEITPVKNWPEPKLPEDLKTALKNSPNAYSTWKDITPLARWDWIRWINATKNLDTRKIRIEKTFSKFKSRFISLTNA